MFLLVAGMAGVSSPALAGKTNSLPPEVQRLIGDLGHSKSAVRTSAQQKLLALSSNSSDVVVNECIKAYAASPDPEITIRLREILYDIFLHGGLRKAPGFLGLYPGVAQTADAKGNQVSAVQVTRLLPSSPADQGGLKDGDLILVIDDLDISQNPSTPVFVQHVRGRNAGEMAKLSIKRGDAFMELNIKLGELPADLQADPETVEANLKQEFEEWLKERLDEDRLKARP